MAKANIKAIESGNFWDTRWVHDRLAPGKPKINAGDIKRLHKAKKDRLRTEQQKTNKVKHKVTLADDIGRSECQGITRKANKIDKTNKQIQYGFDIADWWNEQHA